MQLQCNRSYLHGGPEMDPDTWHTEKTDTWHAAHPCQGLGMGPEYCQGHSMMDWHYDVGVLQVDMRWGCGPCARPKRYGTTLPYSYCLRWI